MMSEYILWAVNNLINWCDLAGVIGVVIFAAANRDKEITNVTSMLYEIFFIDICCWFGDVAVK
jgi:hypothetical protein